MHRDNKYHSERQRLDQRGHMLSRVAAVTLSIACAVVPAMSAGAAMAPWDGFWTATAPSIAAAGGWTLRGVALSADGTLRLAPSAAPLACGSRAIDGGSAWYDPAVGLCAGRDPYPAGGYYNGGRFSYGTLLSPPQVSVPFDHAVVSWGATTPAGTWLQAHLRVRLDTGAWTRWYAFPVWASGMETLRRHSIEGQGAARPRDAASVQTDTLAVRHGHVALAYQLAVTLSTVGDAGDAGDATPTLRRIALALSRIPTTTASTAAPMPRPSAAWGRNLAVPPRSQMLPRYRGLHYGGGGEVWCSPTSISMILAYWGRVLGRPDLVVDVPQAVQGVYDWTYAGTGNWPFNVAYATEFAGMDGYVARFPSLAALEPWIAANVPLALSVAFAPGMLPGAPIPATDGHLLVLRGFDRAGNPIVNDPAAPTDATVQRVYPRAALQQAWLTGSAGTTYVVYPRSWPVPRSQ